MQRGEDIADRNAQHLCAIPIEIKKDRRRGSRIGGEDAIERGVLIGGKNQAAHDRRHFRHRAPFQILQLVLKAAAGSKPDDRRQVEGHHQRRHLRRTACNSRQQRIHLSLGRGAFFKGFQCHDEEGAIGLRKAIQHRKASDALHRLNAGQWLDDRCHLLAHFPRAVERRAIRQLHFNEEGALVFLRQEARRRAAANAINPEGNDTQQNQAEC